MRTQYLPCSLFDDCEAHGDAEIECTNHLVPCCTLRSQSCPARVNSVRQTSAGFCLRPISARTRLSALSYCSATTINRKWRATKARTDRPVYRSCHPEFISYRRTVIHSSLALQSTQPEYARECLRFGVTVHIKRQGLPHNRFNDPHRLDGTVFVDTPYRHGLLFSPERRH